MATQTKPKVKTGGNGSADSKLSAMASSKSPKKSQKGDDGEIQRIVIPAPKFNVTEFTLRGATRLVTHHLSEKTRKMIAPTVGITPEGADKVSLKKKPPRNPVAEFERSRYPVPGKKGVFGCPAIALKECLVVTAKRYYNVDKVRMYGSLWIDEEIIPVVDEHGKPMQPVMREDAVIIGGRNKARDLRYRGSFEAPWFMHVRVRYDADTLDDATLGNLFHRAGYAVGLLEWRSDKGGEWGKFDVVKCTGQEAQ